MIRPPTEAEMVLLDAIEEHSGAQAAAHDGWCLAAGSDGRDGRWWPTTPADTEEALWAAYSRGEGHWSC